MGNGTPRIIGCESGNSFRSVFGGNIRNEHGEVILDRTHSERATRSDVFLIGVNLAF